MSAGEDRKPLEQIEGTYDALDELQQALDDGRRPEPESDLDADDLDWPQIPVSQVARTGLLSARDHLQAVRIHLDARELFPLAQPTLNRAALIGASQAVFVLHHPERPDRIARARRVAHYEYEQLLKYMRASLMVVDAEHKVGVIQGIEQVTRRRDQIQTKRSADGQSAAFNTTDMVSYAARATFPTQPHLVTEAELVWRSTSGSAHGLMWSVLGRRGTERVSDPDDDDVASFEAGGDLQDLANAYLCAFHIARNGLQLWRHRAASPQ